MPTATKKPPAARKKRAAPAAAPTKGGAKPRPRARRSTATWAPRLPHLEQRQLDLIGLALVALGVFLAFPLYAGWDGGAGGRAVLLGLADLVGEVRFAGPVALAAAGGLLVLKPVLPTLRPFRAGALCLLLATTLALAAGTFGVGPGAHADTWWQLADMRDRGGALGEGLLRVTSLLAGTVGAHILAIFLFTAGVLLLTGGTVAGALRATASAAADTTRALRTPRTGEDAPEGGSPIGSDVPPARDAKAGRAIAPPEPEDVDLIIRPGEAQRELDGAVRYPDIFGDLDAPAEPETVVEPEPEALAEIEDEPTVVAPRAKAPRPEPAPKAEADPEPEPDLEPGEQARLDVDPDVDWERPGTGLLKLSRPEDAKPDTAGQETTARSLIEALSHFNVEAKIIGAVAGPHITRYELRLAPGVKMSKVAQMKDDLAYALAATEIRILAPIPGKQAVGVEVPNKKRKMVTLGDVYGPPPKGSTPLTVWLGKDVSGAAIHADLAKMPHILVAGTTGAGKSGCINAMLSSILLRATPEEVRLVLVDPKQVELNHYEAVPHLLTPVITSPRAAANALQNLVREMEWRYGVMSVARTRSLIELNKHRKANGDEPLPYILCVIDELADLMMVAPGDVEDSIIRIAQKARAVGIHLVLATQSPRVDVITGMIKANVPSRIAFAVSSQTDSRVILDQNGGESLLGMGDLLFSAVGSSKLQRIQGAFIDEAQIARLTEFWAAQGEPEIREDLLEEVAAEEPEKAGGEDALDADEDPLLGEAIQLVVEMNTASTSMLQRRLRLGYTRAGRLIDMLERRSIISGYEGSKPRQVLVTESDLPRVLANLAERGDVLAGGEPEDVVDVVLPEPPAMQDEPADLSE
jgi:S-DNA-T family DNA segregation ATPase FtsK/SpoIIIE